MANPVVHFEIIGKDGKKLQAFYKKLFGWAIDAKNPMKYGIVKKERGGIAGGIGQAGGDKGHVTVYVRVDDLEKCLAKAVKLGGKVIMPATEIMPKVNIAMFEDPEGHHIGLVK